MSDTREEFEAEEVDFYEVTLTVADDEEYADSAGDEETCTGSIGQREHTSETDDTECSRTERYSHDACSIEAQAYRLEQETAAYETYVTEQFALIAAATAKEAEKQAESQETTANIGEDDTATSDVKRNDNQADSDETDTKVAEAGVAVEEEAEAVEKAVRVYEEYIIAHSQALMARAQEWAKRANDPQSSTSETKRTPEKKKARSPEKVETERSTEDVLKEIEEEEVLEEIEELAAEKRALEKAEKRVIEKAVKRAAKRPRKSTISTKKK